MRRYRFRAGWVITVVGLVLLVGGTAERAGAVDVVSELAARIAVPLGGWLVLGGVWLLAASRHDRRADQDA